MAASSVSPPPPAASSASRWWIRFSPEVHTHLWILVQLPLGLSCLLHCPLQASDVEDDSPRVLQALPCPHSCQLHSVSQQAFQAEVETTRCLKPGQNKYDSGCFSPGRHQSLPLPVFLPSLCSSAMCSLKLLPKKGLGRDLVSISFPCSFVSFPSSL